MKIKALTLLTLSITLPAFGLGIRIPDMDSEAVGRGNAFVATADNPSAIYYNPAGISQLKGHQLSIGAYTITTQSTFEDGMGGEFDTERDVHLLPRLYYTYTPSGSDLSFGVGLYTPFGLGNEWNDTSRFESMEGQVAYITLNPVVSWKLHDTLSIAAGPTLSYGEAELRRPLPGTPPGTKINFDGDDFAPGFNAGILWQPHHQHSFGVTYRSFTTMDFEGDSHANHPFFPKADTDAEFDFPQVVTVGYSFRPTPKWNLEFNIDWTDWDTLNTVALDRPGAMDPSLIFNWESSLMYQFGVTRYLEDGWRIDGGYIFSENSIPEATFEPLVADSDRHVFSLGAGKSWKQWKVHAGYQFAYGPTRTVNLSGGEYNGDYTFYSHAVTFTVGYRF